MTTRTRIEDITKLVTDLAVALDDTEQEHLRQLMEE